MNPSAEAMNGGAVPSGGDDVYPPAAARNRAVLVRNITHAATGAAIDDFFSFCGAIESKRVRTVPPASGAGHPTLEAVVVFADDAARNTALMMNDSIIVDQPVTIVGVPSGYDFNAAEATGAASVTGGGLMGELGGFFSTFSSTVTSEWKKATAAIDAATETGVLRQAKDGARELTARTAEIASELDDRYHVRNTLLNAAETTKTTANALVEQTRNVVEQVDSQYHISEKTTQLADKALENPAVRNATRSFQTLMHQAGLDGDDLPPAPLPANTAAVPPTVDTNGAGAAPPAAPATNGTAPSS